MKVFSRVFISWISLAITIMGMSGLMYVTVQQNYRTSLNDPQIQMAEDAVYYISQGASVSDVVAPIPIDIGKSLAPFTIVYDKNQKPVAYSGRLRGVVPTPPSGVFAYVDKNGSHRLTWEPEHGVRIAIDVERLSNDEGYVLVGRNMREVESRIRDLQWLVTVGMLTLLIVTFVATLFKNVMARRQT